MSVFPFFFSCPFSFFGVVSDAETGSYLKATPLVEDFSYSRMIYFKLFLNPSLLEDIHNRIFFPEDLGELFRCGHVDMNRFEQLREQQRLDSSSCYEKDLLIYVLTFSTTVIHLQMNMLKRSIISRGCTSFFTKLKLKQI